MIDLGCIDLIRGFIHTVMLEFAAKNIFVIDLFVGVNNQMFLLGMFGGFWLILIGTFINRSARNSYTQTLNEVTLSKISVKDIIPPL